MAKTNGPPPGEEQQIVSYLILFILIYLAANHSCVQQSFHSVLS